MAKKKQKAQDEQPESMEQESQEPMQAPEVSAQDEQPEVSQPKEEKSSKWITKANIVSSGQRFPTGSEIPEELVTKDMIQNGYVKKV